jgi:hypothetical protein
MNWAWWDGKMSAEHYAEEHGLDSPTLLEAARQARVTAEPEPSPTPAAPSGNGQGAGNPEPEAIEAHK